MKHHPEARKLRRGEKTPAAVGDCYESAFTHLVNNYQSAPKLVLVHAVCLIGAGPMEGLPFGHAWCEMPMEIKLPADCPPELQALAQMDAPVLCIDKSNGRNIEMLAQFYYHSGRPTQVHRYTFEQAREWALRTQHYGPWELKCAR